MGRDPISTKMLYNKEKKLGNGRHQSGISRPEKQSDLSRHARLVRKRYTLYWHRQAQFEGYRDEYEMWKKLYLEVEMTSNQLASRLQTTQTTVLNRLEKFKIKRRPPGGANHVTSGKWRKKL